MDKRFFSFLIFAMAIMMGWQLLMRQFLPPPPPPPVVAKQDGEAKLGDAAKPADGAQPADVAKPVEAAVAAPADPAAGAPAQPIAPQNTSPPTWTTLGSLDADGKYRMLVTLHNRGAAVERVELNNPRYHDVDNIRPLGGYLGHLAPQTDAAAKGCKIQVVGPGTPAEKAGLKVGDVVTTVNGKATPDAAAFHFELRKTKPGQTAKIEFARDDRRQTVEIPLRPYPLELVHPEAPDREQPAQVEPSSFLLTLDKLDDLTLDIDAPELQGIALREAYWELLPSDPSKPDEAAFRRVLETEGVEIIKRFALLPRDETKKHDTAQAYTLGLKIEVKNVGANPRKLAYRLDGPTGLPVEGFWYAANSKIGAESGCGMRDVVLGRYVGQNVDHGMFTCRTIADKEATVVADPALQYVGVDSQYFAAVLLPQPNGPTDSRVSRIKPIAVGPIPADSAKKQLTNVSFRLTSKPVDVAPGASAPVDEFKIYLGPKAPDMLAEYQLGPLVDYGWFDWVAEPMLWILHFCYSLVGNYGIAIIMLTIFVRLCMFPMSRKQALGAMKMQELQPEIKRIAEKYKTQPEQRMKAQQELFKKHNYNPFAGCLPIFIQLPIFIGLYRSLAVDVELRQAPLITENIRWASNLAAPDMFWYWEPYLPSFLASENGFLGPFLNLLPCITIVLFIVQQKMFMPPATDEQSAMQQKMMKYMMIFMGFMFFKVPAGLCVYFISSSLWSIAERKVLPKPKPTSATGNAVVRTPPATRGGNGAASGDRKKQGGRKPSDRWREVRRVQAIAANDPQDKVIDELAFSPDGAVVAVNSRANGLHLLSAETLTSIKLIKCTGGATSFSFHPSGERIAILSGEIGKSSVTCFSLPEGKQLEYIPLNTDKINFCLNGSLLACSGSFWKEIKLFRTDTLSESGSLPFEDVRNVVVSPNGQLLACSNAAYVALFDLESQTQRWKQMVGRKVGAGARGLAFSPDGQHVVVGCEGNGDIVSYDIRGQFQSKFGGNLFVPIDGNGAFSIAGSSVAFPASYGVMVCDWKRREKLELLDTGSLRAIAFSPTGARLLAGTWAGTVIEFN